MTISPDFEPDPFAAKREQEPAGREHIGRDGAGDQGRKNIREIIAVDQCVITSRSLFIDQKVLLFFLIVELSRVLWRFLSLGDFCHSIYQKPVIRI